jgi:hypothetical protein
MAQLLFEMKENKNHRPGAMIFQITFAKVAPLNLFITDVTHISWVRAPSSRITRTQGCGLLQVILRK